MNKNFLAFLIIILAGLVYPFFIAPAQEKVTVLRIERQELLDTIEKAKQFAILRDEKLAKKNAISAQDLARVRKMVPEKADVLQNIVDIQNLALSHRLLLTGGVAFSLPGEPAGGGFTGDEDVAGNERSPVSILSLDLTFLGRYEEVKSFLADLSKSLTLYDVPILSFAGVSEGGATSQAGGLSSYTMRIVFYQLAEEGDE